MNCSLTTIQQMTQKPFKNLIWDFDGTLFDTYPVMLKALVQALTEFGVTSIDPESLYQTTKLKSVCFVEHAFAASHHFSASELTARYHELEQAMQVDPQPYPGAKKVLEMLMARGGHNFLDTHRDQSVYRYLKDAGFESYFSGGIDADQTYPRKPDPGAILGLIAEYHLDPAETVMIGDRRLDIEAGDNAKIATIYFNVDQLNDAPMATIQVQQLSEIMPYLA